MYGKIELKGSHARLVKIAKATFKIYAMPPDEKRQCYDITFCGNQVLLYQKERVIKVLDENFQGPATPEIATKYLLAHLL